MSTAVLLAAAGSGTRLGAGMPKALAPLSDGRSLLEHSLEAVAQVPGVDVVVVLVPPEPAPRAEVTAIVEGRVRFETLGGGGAGSSGGEEAAEDFAGKLREEVPLNLLYPDLLNMVVLQLAPHLLRLEWAIIYLAVS